MLKTGEWLSLSIVGLVVLFIFLTISFYSFLIGPNSTGPQRVVEPSSSFIQIVFISIGPAIALSFFTNVVSKDTSKLSSLLVIIFWNCSYNRYDLCFFLSAQVQSIELPFGFLIYL